MPQRGSAAWRFAHYGDPCRAPRESIRFAGTAISVDQRAAAAFQALGVLFAAEYGATDSTQTGAYNCRKIGGTSTWSAHAWGVAVDVDWRLNPMRRPLTTVVPGSLRSIKKRLKTADTGAPVFRWGGDCERRTRCTSKSSPAPERLAKDWSSTEPPYLPRQGRHLT